MTGRPRGFDWDEAKRLRSEGWTYARIGAHLGVSGNCVSYAVNDEARERQYRTLRERAYWRTGACSDCGTAINRYATGGRCMTCRAKHDAFTVSDDLLLCTKCDQWLADDTFPKSASKGQRRGRHALCRPCQTAAKREYRKRTQQPCVTCGTPANTADRNDKTKPVQCLPCAMRRVNRERSAA